mgnify:CR=1 FL=1
MTGTIVRLLRRGRKRGDEQADKEEGAELVAGAASVGLAGSVRPPALRATRWRHHAVMQGADRVAAPGQAEPWEETVHETGERANQHAAAEAEGHAHVLEVGLVDRGRDDR